MKVYLVQHGEAVSKQENPDRPLSSQGTADVRRTAAYLARCGVRVDRVVHSGKLRARQTAELLAAEVADGVQPTATEGLAPKDPTDGLVSNLNTASRDLLVAGHQPFMGRCAAQLLTGDEEGIAVAFRPGSIVCLERGEADGWSLIWVLRPELVAG